MCLCVTRPFSDLFASEFSIQTIFAFACLRIRSKSEVVNEEWRRLDSLPKFQKPRPHAFMHSAHKVDIWRPAKKPHVFMFHICWIFFCSRQLRIIRKCRAIPNAVVQTQNVVSNPNLKPCCIGFLKQVGNGCDRSLVENFVRIETQHPIGRHLAQCKVASLGEVIPPRYRDYSRSQRSRYLDRFVLRASVSDDDFRYDGSSTLHTAAQPLARVPHNHGKPYSGHACPRTLANVGCSSVAKYFFRSARKLLNNACQ